MVVQPGQDWDRETNYSRVKRRQLRKLLCVRARLGRYNSPPSIIWVTVLLSLKGPN